MSVELVDRHVQMRNEILDYDFKFGGLIPSSDTITSGNVTYTLPAQVTVEATFVTGQTVKALFETSGCEAGSEYLVKCHVSTPSGVVKTLPLVLQIRSDGVDGPPATAPSGDTIKRGIITNAVASGSAVVFPVAFANADYSLEVRGYDNGDAVVVTIGNKTASGFIAYPPMDGPEIEWIAIGEAS
jgi:hypothetical protein